MIGLAPAASATESAVDKTNVKVHAKLDKNQVKVGEKVKLKGSLEIDAPARSGSDGLELLLVQKLQAGVWVNIADTSCRPNGNYSLNLSFSVSAQLSLRVYYPGTSIYAAASSEVFGLVVL
ncbi:hypothetical protein [Amycolatopsis anabasis]|uniref:hypothetical protein n=1 Tax=Amycolatopsis anabasis TaxID=1840409 RepID=UPI001FEA110E|nr:hypothetical protein [Amycolatopsis anabasis]